MKNSKKYKYGGGEVKPRNRVLKPKFVKKNVKPRYGGQQQQPQRQHQHEPQQQHSHFGLSSEAVHEPSHQIASRLHTQRHANRSRQADARSRQQSYYY